MEDREVECGFCGKVHSIEDIAVIEYTADVDVQCDHCCHRWVESKNPSYDVFVFPNW